MTREEFEIALRRWGWVYGERPERDEDVGKTPAVHPIARAMEFGHRTMDKRQSVAYRRSPRVGETAWSRDPIPCKETRASIGSPPVAPSRSDKVPLVQAAWLDLCRADKALGEALRLEYQCRDQQAEKAKRLGIGKGKFREMVAEAKGRVFVMLENASRAA